MLTWATTQPQGDTTRGHELPPTNPALSRLLSMYASQPSEEYSESYNYSESSSIGLFPAFHFSLHTLALLSSLQSSSSKGSRKVNLLVAALEVDGPDTIRIKKGPDAGKEVSILKLILGDEEGNVCRLTAWREVADQWGGNGPSVAAKKGDVVYLESKTSSGG